MTEKDKTSLYRPDPDAIWKETVRNEMKAVVKWEDEWGFLVDEYKRCQKNSANTNVFKVESKKIEERRLPEYPNTSAKHIGWLSGRQEFNHEKYGICSKPIRTLYKTFDWPVEGCP